MDDRWTDRRRVVRKIDQQTNGRIGEWMHEWIEGGRE